MKKFRIYVYIVFISLVFLLIFHYSIWTQITKHVLLVHDNIYTGDLGRISMYAKSSFPRQSYPSRESVTLEKEHINFQSWYKKKNKVDILTIGDSFSNAATQGTNPFYQDYIATFNNSKVLNINQLSGTVNYLETILVLNNNGLLDEINPTTIIIESVERFSINRFVLDINKSVFKSYDKTVNEFNKLTNPYLAKDENINFINNQNFKALKFNILYNFDDNAFSSNAYKLRLNDNFFTSEDQNSLLFFNGDLESIPKSTVENIKKLNDNFNKLAELLHKKGIKLYFMPAVDKYNLYSKYINKNSYPKSNFFELLRLLPKKYQFIDTKKILRKELDKGVKDLYYSDDTHWSHKASEVIFKKVKFE